MSSSDNFRWMTLYYLQLAPFFSSLTMAFLTPTEHVGNNPGKVSENEDRTRMKSISRLCKSPKINPHILGQIRP